MRLDTVRIWHPDPTRKDASRLVCPVYDTLSSSEWATYADRPHNAAHFVTHPATLTSEAFLEIARTELQAALGAGAYQPEAEPALFVYGIRYRMASDVAETYPAADRRAEYLLLGLVGTVSIDDDWRETIAPHERTFPDRVEERRRLGAATGFQFAPIVAGYSMPGHEVNDALERELGIDRRGLDFEGRRPPLLEVTLNGMSHRLWAVRDPHVIAHVRSLLSDTRLLILDGHHRFQAQLAARRAGETAHALMMLVESRDRALLLRPWHRRLAQAHASWETWAESARTRFGTITDLGASFTMEGLLEELSQLARSGRTGFIMMDRGRAIVVRGPPREGPGSDFEVLHTFLAQNASLQGEPIEFVATPRQTAELTRAHGGLAFLLPTTTVEAIEDLAFSRRTLMAEKSTMFLPKVVDGLLFAPWDG